jgi:Lipase (class 3)
VRLSVVCRGLAGLTTVVAALLSGLAADAGNPNCPPPVINGTTPKNWSCPTGTQSQVRGNPNCPPPVINGIVPKNWSCPTGTQAVTPRLPAQNPDRTLFGSERCVSLPAAKNRLLATMHDVAAIVFENYQRKPILIARIGNLQNAYLVALSGTEPLKIGQSTHLPQDVLTSINVQDEFSRNVVQAMLAYRDGAGVPQGARIILAGHSLGGMVAQNLAANIDFATNWPPQRVLTLGSPKTVNEPRGTAVRRFATIGDPVPYLSPAAYSGVRFEVGNQTWIANGLPSGNLNPIAPHMVYDTVDGLGDYDAFGEPLINASRGQSLVLDQGSLENCIVQPLN